MPETTHHTPDEVADWQNIADIMHTWPPDLRAHAQRVINARDIPVTIMTDTPQSGHDVRIDRPEHESQAITLDRHEIRPQYSALGETEIVLQRHGKYVRDKDSPNAGQLTPEAVQLETESAAQYFSELIAATPESDRDNLCILFVLSDTSYANNGQRSYQTTEIAQQVAEQLFQEHGMHLLNILNISPRSTSLGAPVPMRTLREPQMFEKSPDFLRFMQDAYPDPENPGALGRNFWVAFEEDAEYERRHAMGAEGPDEIADRMRAALQILSRYSEAFHAHNPQSRLIIWAGTHYDTISPFVKRDVLHMGKKERVLVAYGGGLVVTIDQSHQLSAAMNGHKYPLDL